MEYKFLDIVNLKRFKNGNVRFSFDEHNVYKMLFGLGFRQTTLDGKKVLYKRQGEILKKIEMIDLKRAVGDFIESIDLPNDIPRGIVRNRYLKDFYSGKKVIRQSYALEHHLTETVTNEYEIHQLRLFYDDTGRYTQKFKISQIIEKLKIWGFTQKTNETKIFESAEHLYYKKLDQNKYLIFSHYGGYKVNNSGIDLWIAMFREESDIGRKKWLNDKLLTYSFDLNEDFHLIKDYV